MSRKFLRRVLMALTPILGVFAMLAMSAMPSQAATVGTRTSQYLAGYAGANNGLKAFAAIEGTAVMPNEPASVMPDSVAVGGVLQRNAGMGGPTIGAGYVWNDIANSPTALCANGASRSDSWILEEGAVPNGTPGAPLPPSSLKPIIVNTSPNQVDCVTPGHPAFYEIYYSTALNEINILGGTEPGDLLLQTHAPWPFGTMLHEFGVGVDTSDGAVASDLAIGNLASFTRDGLTVLASPHVGAHAITRVTLNAENLNIYQGTQDGTSAGAPTLSTSGMSTGSAFTVKADV